MQLTNRQKAYLVAAYLASNKGEGTFDPRGIAPQGQEARDIADTLNGRYLTITFGAAFFQPAGREEARRLIEDEDWAGPPHGE